MADPSFASTFDVLDPIPQDIWSEEARRDADPHHPLPDISVEFPGVTRWFELRRRANQDRERKALLAFAGMPVGLACDVPIAGADWPYGQPVDVDSLHEEAVRHSMSIESFRVYAIPDPPGTVLRVRRSSDPQSLDFATAICRLSRESEMVSRSKAPAAPFAALCAHFAGRTMHMRWMGAFAPAGLTRTAPPDSVAQTMAAYASSLVMDLPYFASDLALGDPRFDLILDATYCASTVNGRARLDAAEAVVMDIDPRLGLRVDPGPVGGDGPEWHICGFSAEVVSPALRGVVQDSLFQATSHVGADPNLVNLGPRRSDDRFLARIGHGVSACLARAPHDASFEEVVLLFAAEHGLACGHDRRVRRYAQMLAKHGHSLVCDLRLALDRVAAIEGDPCRAHRIRAAMDCVV